MRHNGFQKVVAPHSARVTVSRRWQSRRFRPLLRLISLVVLQAFLASNVAWAGGSAGLDNLRNQASQETAVASGLEERLKEPTDKQAPSDPIPQPLIAQAPTFWQVRGNEAPGAVQLGGLEEGAKAARPGALTGWKKWLSVATILLGSYVQAFGQDAVTKPLSTPQPPAAVMVQQGVTPARPSLPQHLQAFAPVMGERLTVFYVRWYRPHPPGELSELQASYKDRGVQVNFLYLTDRPVRGTIQELPGGAVKRYQISFSDFWRTLDTYQAADGRWHERDTRHFPRVIVMDFLGNLAQPDPSQLRTFLDESLQTMERQEEAKRAEQEERQKTQTGVDRLKKEQQDLSAQTKRLMEEIEPLRKMVEHLKEMPKVLQQEIQKLQEQKKQADQAVKDLETKRSAVQEEVQKLQQDQARLAKEAEEARQQLERIRVEQKQVPPPVVGVQPPSMEAPRPSLPWPWIIVGGAGLLALGAVARDIASRIRRKAIGGRAVIEAVGVSPAAETEALRQEGDRLQQERTRLVGEVEGLQRKKEELERQVASLQEEAKVKPPVPAGHPAAAVAPPPPQTLDEAVVAVQRAGADLQARIQQGRERLDSLSDRLERAFGQLQKSLEAELNPETMTVPQMEERHRQQEESIQRSTLAEERKRQLLDRIQKRLDQARQERGRMLEAIRQELEPNVQALADAGSVEVFDRRLEELQQEASRRLPDERERSSILDSYQGEIERHRQAAQDRQRQERERLERMEAQKQQHIEALQRQLKEMENRFSGLQRAEDQEEFDRLAAELDAVPVPAELAELLRPDLEQANQAMALAQERIAQAEREQREEVLWQRIQPKVNALAEVMSNEQFDVQVQALEREIRAEPDEGMRGLLLSRFSEAMKQVKARRVEQAKEKLWVSFLRGWKVPKEIIQDRQKRQRLLEEVKQLRGSVPNWVQLPEEEKGVHLRNRLKELSLIPPAAPAEPAAREDLTTAQGAEASTTVVEAAPPPAPVVEPSSMVEVKPVRSQEEFLDWLRAGDTNPEDPLRKVVEDHLSSENRFTLKSHQPTQIYRPEDDSVLALGLYKNESGENELGVKHIDRSTGEKKRVYTWPLPRPGDLHLDLLPKEVITQLQRLGFGQDFLQTVEVGGLVLLRPDGSFFLVELPHRSPNFVLADVDLTKLLKENQPVHKTNMYDWLKKFYDPKGYPAILGIHTQPLSSDPPKLSLEDFKELEDQQEAPPVSPWQLVVQPNGVALGTVTLVSREGKGRLSIQEVRQVAEDQIPRWVRDLPSKVVAAPRTGLEEAAGVRPPVASILREPSFFTRTAQVPGSIFFFVDTKEDPRTLRLAQLAAVIKAREGWAIEFAGVARQAELDAAVEELKGDIGSQVILENRILAYETDAEYLEKRAEALRRLPEGVKLITKVNRETMIWFDEAIQAVGLSYMSEEQKRRIHAFLEAA